MPELRSAIDGLAAVEVGGLPAAALGEHIRALMQQRNRLDGQIQRALTTFDGRGYCEADGAPSTASWLRGRCRISGSEAASRIKTARMMRELPHTTAALEAGAITLGHARAIATLADETAYPRRLQHAEVVGEVGDSGDAGCVGGGAARDGRPLRQVSVC